MIKKQGDFYLLDNKLLYACKDFIGFNPTISKALTYDSTQEYGTKVKLEEFFMKNRLFNAILTYFWSGGPLRGYHRIEIMETGKTIILYETGGKGHGINYSTGNKFLVVNNNAYLYMDNFDINSFKLENTNADSDKRVYYFLWFTDIVIPTKNERVVSYDGLADKNIYTREEIKHLRQTEWHADVNFNGRQLSISQSTLPGFLRQKWDSKGNEEFIRCARRNELTETIILENGVNQLEEKKLRTG